MLPMKTEDGTRVAYINCPNCGGPCEIKLDISNDKPVPTDIMCEACEKQLVKLNQKIKDKKEGKVAPKKKKATNSGYAMKDVYDIFDEFFKNYAEEMVKQANEEKLQESKSEIDKPDGTV